MFVLLIIAAALIVIDGDVDALGTLHPKLTPTNNVCLLTDDTIGVRPRENRDCTTIQFNVHKYNNNLVLNFLNKKHICNYLCIDKCGNVYHDSVFHTEDCVLTTSALEYVDTLSVYRGNYSDFFAIDSYYSIPFSMKSGNSVERFYSFIALQFNNISAIETCTLMLTPFKTTQECSSTSPRYYNLEYIDRSDYRSYSLWNKILIMLGIKNYLVPKNETMLSYIEYNN